MSKQIIAAVYPLSPMQAGMLYHYLSDQSSESYFEQFSLRVQGQLDISTLELCLNHVIAQNETLRTVIRWSDLEKPVQIVLHQRPQKIHLVELTHLATEAREEMLRDVKAQEKTQGFDLERGPLCRLTVCKLDSDLHEIIWSFHHIVMDGWSSGVVWREIFLAYQNITIKQPLLQIKKTSIKEYLKFLQDYNREAAGKFWHNYLEDFAQTSILPRDFQTDGRFPKLANLQCTLSPDWTTRLIELSKQHKITVNQIVQLAWGLLVQRYTNSDDVVFGTTVAGRPYHLPQIQEMVGLFINTVPVRLQSRMEQPIIELFQELKINSFKRTPYEFSSLLEIKAESELSSQDQLFDHIFVFENAPIEQVLDKSELGFRIVASENQMRTNFDLTVVAMLSNTLNLQFIYNAFVFSSDTITRMTGHLQNLIKQIITNPNSLVKDLELMGEEEKNTILKTFNQTEVVYPSKLSVHQLIEEQVKRTPDQPALVFDGKTLSYRELNERANRLAHKLRQHGVGRNTLVGVMIERSFEMIIGILAILKAGGAYLPIDPLYPEERINYMLTNAKCSLLLKMGHEKQIHICHDSEIRESLLEVSATGELVDDLENINSPEDLTYVIYTSGSTGKPKGVALKHQNLINLLYFEIEGTNIDYSGRILQFTSLSFDVSFQEIFTPLVAGGTVFLISDEARKDIHQLLHCLNENQIEILSFPFSYLNFLFEEKENVQNLPPSVKHIITAGEQLIITDSLHEYLQTHSVYLHNHYGPSETHVVTTLTLDGSMDLPRIPGIGRPISNTQIYILDQNLRPTPIGIPGEIYLSGAGVGHGYLHRQDLTNERFIYNPFAESAQIKLMYKTGDLGRWLADGSIEFLGRLDYQVKIRGFRVEIGEIEAALLTHEWIKQAVVVAKMDEEKRKYLVGYLVVESELTVNVLRQHLLQSLPDYMVPSTFVFLDALPMTPNGKVDRKALPAPDQSTLSQREYVAPRNSAEEVMARIWAEVLKVDSVGIHDNFFELGGHSLKATQIVSRFAKEMSIQIPLRLFFTAPTIAELVEKTILNQKSTYQEIPVIYKASYYSVSHAQRRLWLINQFEEGNIAYNMPVLFKMQGELNLPAFQRAFQTIIERHEILRTCFAIIDDELVQKVEDELDFEIPYLIWQSDEIALKEKIHQVIMQPFDLTKPGLLRATLIKLAEGEHLFLFVIHHIISDGWSNDVMVHELGTLYDAYSKDKSSPLSPLKIQYRDYAAWQNNLLQSEEMKVQEAYWLNHLQGELPVLNLPYDFKRLPMQTFQGDNINFNLGKDLSAQLYDFTKRTGVSLFMTLFAAYRLLLHRYTGQNDIIIGTPIAGRQHKDLEELIGFFVNSLALRTQLTGDESFQQLVHTVKQTVFNGMENQDYPFDLLVKQLNLERDVSRSAVFDTMFTLQTVEMNELCFGQLRLKLTEFEFKMSRFDVILNMIDCGDELTGNINYDTNLFKRETIERMIEHFIHLLTNAIHNPSMSIDCLEMVSPEEKERVINDFNQTQRDYPREKNLQQLFEEQVAKNPEHTAVILRDKTLTYSELNAKANRLAQQLRSLGVQPDYPIGVLMNRSLDMIVALVGIIKAGGAFVPIDPTLPKSRIVYILEDAAINLFVVQSELLNLIPEAYQGQIVKIEELTQNDTTNLTPIVNSANLAYIMYTSGSTGKPKGVLVNQSSIIRLVKSTNYVNITADDRLLQISNYSFDGSTFDIWGALLNGASIVLLTQEEISSLSALTQLIKQSSATITFIPTAMFNNIADLDPQLFKGFRKVLIGGERLSSTHVAKVYKETGPGVLSNVYGPTETTTFASAYEITTKPDELDSISIGKPIANTTIYILDNQLQPVPIGVAGELYIGGEGVARGYLNRPELTKEKFLDNPFISNQRMYKTGDLARWLVDGNIEFIGRIDQQVKIRGFRIEVGEIEATILKHEAIKDVVVLPRMDTSGNKYLAAYLVLQKEIEITELRSYLKKLLPEYMIPAYYVTLTELPLTSNGKIDQKRLPEPDYLPLSKEEYIASRNETEDKLVQIWSEVLGIKNIGVKDNFFEIGGHSLKATTLLARIYRELDVEIPLRQIFKTPTIEGIAQYIAQATKSLHTLIEPVEEREYYPISAAQKRLLFINQLENANIGYNMPGALLINGEIDFARLEKTFTELIERHEAFRTSFDFRKGEPVQLIHHKVDFAIELANERELLQQGYDHQHWMREFIRPFDLAQTPLLRVGMLKLAGESVQYLLIYDMHHIIADGLSMNILVHDMVNLYSGIELPTLKVQYKDFAVWQNQYFTSDEFKREEQYWLERFTEEIPILNLPTDIPRPAVKDYVGDWVSFVIDQELTRGLKQLVQNQEATLYMILLAAFNILMSKYSDQDDIIVGTPIAGRPHADVENVIGMFVNTLAMRNQPKRDKTFTQFFAEVKENALLAFENQNYPFDQLVNQLDIARDASRKPLFDVMFILQNIGENISHELSRLQFSPYPLKNPIAKFDITCTAVENGPEINVTLEYSTKLWKKATIERMGEHYLNILRSVIAHPDIRLADIEILSKEESQRLLIDFNATKIAYPAEKTLVQIFEDQVAEYPENIAVAFADQQLTYKAFNHRVNQLARRLRELGVGPNTTVGILGERSLEMIIGLMAIVKAGGAYLPIDYDYPPERIEYMLADSQAKFLLLKSIRNDVNFAGEKLNLTDKINYHSDTTNLSHCNRPDDIVNIIYTSGSTGKPKGVLINHRNINRLISGLKMINLTATDRVLQGASIAFDASTLEIWSALLNGAGLYLISKEQLVLVKDFASFITQHQITVAQMTTPLFNQLVEENPASFAHFRAFIVGGDVLLPKYLNLVKQLAPEQIFINAYGPTESTVISTFYKLPEGLWEENTNIPIGRPFANTQVYILDSNEHVQPIGVPGELCISGDGLALGYGNRPDLTAEKFVANPFVSGKRMYKTGDLARWLPDGNLEFLGRIDHQVKIRGFRIEIGEIEALFLKHEAIKDTIVLARTEKPGDKHLAAYLVTKKEIEAAELRSYLRKFLPDYMIPSYFIFLEELPLTSTGKVDLKQLSELTGEVTTELTYHKPTNMIEEKLAMLWTEILGITHIGRDDNFFEIGGHSLKAAKIVSAVYTEFGVEISLQDFYQEPTIHGLAKIIQTKEKSQYYDIEQVPEQEYYELSYAQKRLWILQQLHPDSMAYNLPGNLTLHEPVDPELIRKIFMILVERHEGLRTRFIIVNGAPMQVIDQEGHFNYIVKDISNSANKESDKEKIFAEINNQPYDLTTGPLLRVALIKYHENEYELIYAMHHIITDGWSISILQQEFSVIYEAMKAKEEWSLPELKIQYKDFCAWQNKILTDSERINVIKDFWATQLRQPLPILQLPKNGLADDLTDRSSAGYRFVIPAETANALTEIAQTHHTSLFTILLTGFNLFLAKFTGQLDILIGIAAAGRDHANLKNVIGFFVNTIILRNQLDLQATFTQTLEKIHSNTLQTLEYQSYPLELFLDQLEMSYPEISVFLNMLNLFNSEQQELINTEPYHIPKVQDVKFEIACYIIEYKNGIEIFCNYLKGLFEPEIIEYMMNEYVNMLTKISQNPQATLAEYITKVRKRRITRD